MTKAAIAEARAAASVPGPGSPSAPAKSAKAAKAGAGSLEVAQTVLHPPVSSAWLRPVMDTLGFVSTGLLPEPLRRGYGLSWTPAHAAALAGFTRSLRLATAALPRRFRISPVYDLALARSEGRWPDSRAA